jgi:hypothetical protein
LGFLAKTGGQTAKETSNTNGKGLKRLKRIIFKPFEY